MAGRGGSRIQEPGVVGRRWGTVGMNNCWMSEPTPCEGGLLQHVGLQPVQQSTCFVVGMAQPTNHYFSIYYLYVFIRRPRLILDFALTLVFNHLVLTTYYSASIPTSIFFWVIVLGGSAITVIMAEQLCVKREMTEGLSVAPLLQEEQEVEEMELGGITHRD